MIATANFSLSAPTCSLIANFETVLNKINPGCQEICITKLQITSHE
jgi:hypothetical protein